MANGRIGSSLNKKRFKQKKIMSDIYFGCSQDYKKSTEQYTMTYTQYKIKFTLI